MIQVLSIEPASRVRYGYRNYYARVQVNQGGLYILRDWCFHNCPRSLVKNLYSGIVRVKLKGEEELILFKMRWEGAR